MSHSLVCCPVKGKAKSRVICEAFAEGCTGGQGSVFYGVDASNMDDWRRAETYWYIDNSYWDCVRQKQFRVTKNALQIIDSPVRDYKRLDALGIKFRPWRDTGRYILLVEQSKAFMELVGYRGSWLGDTLRELGKHTDRPVRVRNWTNDKAKASQSLAAELQHAWCLVTHMSAAANEAVAAGVPVFVTGKCAATPMASGSLSNIERPKYPDGVRDWAAGLAANQWSIEELKNGTAWKHLCGGG